MRMVKRAIILSCISLILLSACGRKTPDAAIDLTGYVGISVEKLLEKFDDMESETGYDGTMIYSNEAFEATSILQDGEPGEVYSISIDKENNYSISGVKVGMEFEQAHDILEEAGYVRQDEENLNEYISDEGIRVLIYLDEDGVYVKSIMAFRK